MLLNGWSRDANEAFRKPRLTAEQVRQGPHTEHHTTTTLKTVNSAAVFLRALHEHPQRTSLERVREEHEKKLEEER